MRKTLLPLFAGLAFAATAQEVPETLSDRTFELGEVRVSGIHTHDSVASRLSHRTIEKFNRNNLSNALNILPGVSIANVGPRNESVVYLRGFDLRQVPVYIDGVPVYVPYDGYVDMGRFTTFDARSLETQVAFKKPIKCKRSKH
ncbi:Plug domain-containing protein [Dyadobacter sp. 676]|uniref:Plug domain-containing protein n=1 Tax=Dyadobacter sp. 676 TaxID=3088362 RepID=A0AAU8FPL8_9BACT